MCEANDPPVIPVLTLEPVGDISPRVVSLARAIDRLPAGREYVITLTKPPTAGADWRASISISERVREMTLKTERGT